MGVHDGGGPERRAPTAGLEGLRQEGRACGALVASVAEQDLFGFWPDGAIAAVVQLTVRVLKFGIHPNGGCTAAVVPFEGYLL